MPVPARVVEASRDAFDLHDPSVAVAHLVYDSVLDGWPATSTSRSRRLVFEAQRPHARIRMDVARDRSRLDVRLRSTAGCVDIILLRPDGSLPIRSDRKGRVRVAPLRPGLMSLLVRMDDSPESVVRTAWVVT